MDEWESEQQVPWSPLALGILAELTGHDLWQAEQRLTDELKKIPGHSAR